MAFARKNVKDLQAQLQQLNKTSNADYGPDLTEWKPTTDAQGNASAIIRFLPATENTGHVLPFVKIYNHGFQAGQRWFIENCPTTNGGECPVCAMNSELWDTGIESNKTIVRARKRKLSYWANILVIKDSKNPAAEGKVFKYRFGQKIMDKIDAKMDPDMDLGMDPEDVTCVFDGSNFVLKVKRVPGQYPGQFFPNYDESAFQGKSELFGGDEEKLDKLEAELHDLSKINGPSAFKTAAELQEKLNKVLKISPKAAPTQQAAPVQQTQQAAPVQQTAPVQSNDNVDDELDALLGDLGL